MLWGAELQLPRPCGGTGSDPARSPLGLAWWGEREGPACGGVQRQQAQPRWGRGGRLGQETDQRRTLRPKGRNAGKKSGATARGVAERVGTTNTGDRPRAQSPCHHLLSLLPTLNPHPKQDAVTMTTWPARKQGGGLQRKFSTSAGREEGVMHGRHWPIHWGHAGPLGPQNIMSTAPQDSHPAPTQQTGPRTSGPLWERGKA